MTTDETEQTGAGAAGAPAPLAARALETTAENPWPLRLLSMKMGEYISKMAPVWVEGQIVEANRRAGMSFFTLRDTDADVSVRLTAYSQVLDRLATPLKPGSQVVVQAKPTFYAKRGDLSLHASAIRAVGLGELLARIDQLRRVLAAEGLFDAERKQPLPFLPQRIGLICGREAKAMDDVLVNARDRFPEVQFEVRQVAVQGNNAVSDVTRALAELDGFDGVEVIIITRGGGSVEDLLPFSNEALVRAASNANTPIVSAIGHETDAPLLDLVADYRASTPTDAAKRVVPDVAAEREGIAMARDRIRAAMHAMVATQQERLDAIRSRPVLSEPTTMVTTREQELHLNVRSMRLALGARLDRCEADISTLTAQVRALSPAATMERGYAVLRDANSGTVIRATEEVTPGQRLEAVLARGRFGVQVSVESD